MTASAGLPVFIIGAARSGTKFVRDTLAAAPGLAAVPYDINYVWRRGNEGVPHDELEPSTVDHRLVARIRSDVRRQAAHGAVRSPPAAFLEKTVSNTLRVPFVSRIFPEALYIHLVRDGRQVVESSWRMWHDRPDWQHLIRKLRTFGPGHWRYALSFLGGFVTALGSGRPRRTWGPVYRGMLEDLHAEPLEVVVARQWRRCVSASMEGLSAIPAGRVTTLRYEEVIASPNWIAPVLELMGRGEAEEAVFGRFRETLRMPPRDRWETTFSLDERRRIWAEIESVVAAAGYPV